MKEHAEAAVRREMEEFDRDVEKYRKTGKKQRGAIGWWILTLIMLAVIYALRVQGTGTAVVLGYPLLPGHGGDPLHGPDGAFCSHRYSEDGREPFRLGIRDGAIPPACL